MIPVGTLCEFVGPVSAYTLTTRALRGRFGTVTSHSVDRWGRDVNVVTVPGDARRVLACDSALRPIVPPGDPDAILTREPERAFA